MSDATWKPPLLCDVDSGSPLVPFFSALFNLRFRTSIEGTSVFQDGSLPVSLRAQILELDVGNDEVDADGGDWNKDEENPVDGGGEHQLVHSGHVRGHKLYRRPEVRVGDEVDKPDRYTAPDKQLGDVVPAVHEQGGLEAGGDDHHGVDSVAEHKVAVREPILPQYPGLHGPLAQPEE